MSCSRSRRHQPIIDREQGELGKLGADFTVLGALQEVTDKSMPRFMTYRHITLAIIHHTIVSFCNNEAHVRSGPNFHLQKRDSRNPHSMDAFWQNYLSSSRFHTRDAMEQRCVAGFGNESLQSL